MAILWKSSTVHQCESVWAFVVGQLRAPDAAVGAYSNGQQGGLATVHDPLRCSLPYHYIISSQIFEIRVLRLICVIQERNVSTGYRGKEERYKFGIFGSRYVAFPLCPESLAEQAMQDCQRTLLYTCYNVATTLHLNNTRTHEVALHHSSSQQSSPFQLQGTCPVNAPWLINQGSGEVIVYKPDDKPTS